MKSKLYSYTIGLPTEGCLHGFYASKADLINELFDFDIERDDTYWKVTFKPTTLLESHLGSFENRPEKVVLYSLEYEESEVIFEVMKKGKQLIQDLIALLERFHIYVVKVSY